MSSRVRSGVAHRAGHYTMPRVIRTISYYNYSGLFEGRFKLLGKLQTQIVLNQISIQSDNISDVKLGWMEN